MCAYKRISPQPVIEGGTGIQSATTYAPIVGGTTSTGAFQSAGTGISNSGYVLTSTGSSSLPTWQAGGGSGVCGSVGFFYYINSGSSFAFTGPTGYYMGSTIALTSRFDNSGGAFFPGTGSGSGQANAATYTIPATGFYSFSMLASFNTFSSVTLLFYGPTAASFSGAAYMFYENPTPILDPGTASISFTGTANYYMTAGTVVYFFLNVNNGGGASVAGFSNVSGYRIS